MNSKIFDKILFLYGFIVFIYLFFFFTTCITCSKYANIILDKIFLIFFKITILINIISIIVINISYEFVSVILAEGKFLINILFKRN